MEPGNAFVFFDLGGTLVDLRGLLDAAARALREEFPGIRRRAGSVVHLWGIRVARELVRAQGSRFVPERVIAASALQAELAACGIRVGRERAARVVRRAREDFESRARLCAGVSRTWLEGVHRHAAGTCIVTDGDVRTTGRLLERTGILPCFDAVVVSETVRAYKPHPRIYREALRAVRAPAERSVFVSDSAVDLYGAVALFMEPVLVPRPFAPDAGDPPEGTRRLRSMRDLDAVLERFSRTGRFG